MPETLTARDLALSVVQSALGFTSNGYISTERYWALVDAIADALHPPPRCGWPIQVSSGGVTRIVHNRVELNWLIRKLEQGIL